MRLKRSRVCELLEFAYARALETHELTAPNLLGLAEIRLRAGKIQEGTALLRRLALVVGEPNENLDAAAALLERRATVAMRFRFSSAVAGAAVLMRVCGSRKIGLWRSSEILRRLMIFAAWRAIQTLLTRSARRRRWGLRAGRFDANAWKRRARSALD